MARNKAKSFSETISKLEAMMTAAAKSKESTISFWKEMGKTPEDLAPVHKKKRVPLMEVVRNCNRRWFQETLKEAKDGNADKQVLLGQMYCFGYGVREDDHRMTNVVELKVGLHCEECIKMILKTIKKIRDIETYNIDTKLNKVRVTGNVTEEQVIRVLHKIGKTASSWEDELRAA